MRCMYLLISYIKDTHIPRMGVDCELSSVHNTVVIQHCDSLCVESEMNGNEKRNRKLACVLSFLKEKVIREATAAEVSFLSLISV